MRRRVTRATLPCALLLTLALTLGSFGQPAAASGSFTFYGSGDGHGIGMSQWGAQGMALNGANYEQILKHYYQGIALTNIGGA